ncbi:MAG: anaerobic glycerol-3-phosphate dehydrogenase subunit C [Anaerolineae bacterium]
MTQQTHPLLILFGEDFARKTRQCVSCNLCRQFCPVFPQLFALLRRASRSPDTEPAEAAAYLELLDQCWLCGRCELRCPGDLGFSQQVIRTRLANPAGAHPEDRLLSRPQEIGRLGSLLAPLANAWLGNKTLRRLSERLTGIDHRAIPPPFQWMTFRRWFAGRKRNPYSENGLSKTKIQRRVAYFVGCHGDYFGRSVGQAAVAVLERNGVEVVCPDFRCCGLPQVAAGDGARAEANARFNIERFAGFVEAGYDVVTTCSTCSLALKHHYPELWPSAASKALAERIWDIFSYLKTLHDAGELDLEFRPLERSVRYHYPCHARYQRYGNQVIDLLRLIPGLKIDYAAMACCGMGGTHGFKRRHYDPSQQQATETFAFLDQVKPDGVVTDCPMCVYRIGTGSGLETIHPVELLQRAYRQ